MSNFSPVSSIDVADAATLNLDSESGVRLMQTAIFTDWPRGGLILAEVSGASRLCQLVRVLTYATWRLMRPFFVRAVQRCLTAVVILGSSAVAASAQVTDTPVPFDTSGTVRSISPTLVTRLGLSDPLWPVRGDFIEARLF